MKCVRCWRPRPASRVAPHAANRPGRNPFRPFIVTLSSSALKTGGANSTLSLNDIIAFESQLPSLVAQEAVPPEEKVDQLVERAARVLEEVNSMLLSDSSRSSSSSTTTTTTTATGDSRQQNQQQQQDGAAAIATLIRPLPGQEGGGPGDGVDGGSELSRAVFGGSAQVSEREASRMRAALQRTLEGSSAAGNGNGNSNGNGGALVFGEALGTSAAAPAAAAASPAPKAAGPRTNVGSRATNSPTGTPAAPAGGDQERPAWAQALFSSASAAAPSTSSPSSVANSGATLKSSSSSSASASASTSSRPVAKPPAASSSSFGSGGASGRRSAAASSSPSSSTSASYSPPQSPSPPGPASSTQGPQLAPAPAPSARRTLAEWAPLAFAEADLSTPTELFLKSEESLFTEAARAAVLPPLQSVVDLTAAVRPPTRGLDLGGVAAPSEQHQAVSDAVSVSEEEVVQGNALGRRLADGAGRLADGTRFEKLSGTDVGPDGYVKKWEVLRGVTGDGRVQWEECWWQASNRYGLRELGAFKKGTAESGASWVEEWKEVLHTHPNNLRLVIERTAHKWARDENSDEWEEKWGECFEEAGRVHKWADKWAKAGSNVWHERWGEDYDGRGACQKWTDKWAERLLPDGGQEQWGDKWTETFGDGRGTKHGEVWSSSSGGSRYNRWWNEEHYGDSRVRKWGNSTSGEYWDTVEHMDTYYNPVPHFGFKHAVGHSPQLWSVPLPAPDEADGSGGDGDDDGLGVGLGRL